MSLIQIDQFTWSRNFTITPPATITVYYDDTTDAITATISPCWFSSGWDSLPDASIGISTTHPDSNRTKTTGELWSVCTSAGTLVQFIAKQTKPFALLSSKTYDAPSCALSRVCDIAITSVTAVMQNHASGTITVAATTSKTGLQFAVYNTYTQITTAYQPSGVFSGLAPGIYVVYALDDLGCIDNQTITLRPYVAPTNSPGDKYRLEFTSIQGNDWLLKIYDTDNLFTTPVYLTGQPSPLVKTYTNSDEFKFEPIVGASIDINLVADGLFDPNEFALADERKWKVELYKNGVLDFQGWILPDEITDVYYDTPYNFTMKATDGLASLKGVPFLDFLGRNVYGVIPLTTVLNYCLSQLNYDFAQASFVTAFFGWFQTTGNDFWSNLTIWGDNFYSPEGVPDDVYTVIEKICTAFALTLFQHAGQLFFWSISDLNTPSNHAQMVSFTTDFSSYSALSIFPGLINIGSNGVQPVNPQQTIRYDKAISQLIVNADFQTTALINTDPSFEYGNIEGQLPSSGWYQMPPSTRGVDKFALVQYDPVNAYTGSWLFRITNGNYMREWYVENNWPVTQLNKKLNVSFMWRPSYVGSDKNPIVCICIIFLDTVANQEYAWNFNGNPAGWVTLSEPPMRVDEIISRITLDAAGGLSNYDGYNSWSTQTDVLPGNGIGSVYLRFYPATLLHDGGAVDAYSNSGAATTDKYYVEVDNLQLSLIDGFDDYNFQISEIHQVTNVARFSKSQTKNIDTSIYSFASNNSIAGNLLYGGSMSTITVAVIAQGTQGVYAQSKLPELMARRIAANHQRPMMIWNGDVFSDSITFYNQFTVNLIAGKVFVPISISIDYKNCISTLVLVENDTQDAQGQYLYTPKFKKSTRSLS